MPFHKRIYSPSSSERIETDTHNFWLKHTPASSERDNFGMFQLHTFCDSSGLIWTAILKNGCSACIKERMSSFSLFFLEAEGDQREIYGATNRYV